MKAIRVIIFVLVTSVALCGSTANAQLMNGGFETGDLTGWTTTGMAEAVVSEMSRDFLGLLQEPGSDFWESPEGDYFASLWSADNAGMDVAKLSQTFTTQEDGLLLKFDYFFDFGDNAPLYDTAMATLCWSVGSVVLFEYNTAGQELDDDENIGWTPVSVALPTAGIYTLEFATEDLDGTFESILGVDNFRVTVVDNTPPQVEIIVPQPDAAVQDGVTFLAAVDDVSEVVDVYFCVREPDGGSGTPIGYEELPAILTTTHAQWEYQFDTTVLPDGYYVILSKAIDSYGNEGWSEVVPFSIRNWTASEMLPASASNKAGRTVPIKFSLKVDEAVDPARPFIHNEQLEIKIYDASDPDTILHTSLFGDTSGDFRINDTEELYITNFKTDKSPAEYVVEIWRLNEDFLIGSFAFETDRWIIRT